ncbi:site-specific integrase [Polynucleobacter sp. MWH-Mekk-B1]|uniref:site-specific integrase n=1 Tax=Polynucleobacter finlandensis TaxID=1855894 RepID=UPI001C0DA43A|nr:site-specific integrase [Polynucleobacter finlandensis]MBU3543470.1 site-specific integrase [Polynucleobacter finlandensis]
MAKSNSVLAGTAGAEREIAVPAVASATRKHVDNRKAYELLANQAVSLAGLSSEDRGNVVISAVFDDDGDTVVLSRVKDMVWEMWPFVDRPNLSATGKRLNWGGIPVAYREACQNVLYHYMRVGRSGWRPPSVARLTETLYSLKTFCRFAEKIKLKTLADMGTLHIANFVHEQKKSGLASSRLAQQFAAIELLYLFRSQHDGALQVHPWPDSSAQDMAGRTGKNRESERKVGLTPLMPVEVAQRLFLYAEDILSRADMVLDERDRGDRPVFQNSELTKIRNACFYLMGVLTGMRSSELSSIEIDAGRVEIRNEITFNWVTSVEHKTTGGRRVDYLMPSMGLNILRILERWSQPHRAQLAEQIAVMERKTGKCTNKELQWLVTARRNTKKLFLGNGGANNCVPISGLYWASIFKKFALDAGTDWSLSPHQMRRLYAYTFARHRLGDMLFIKEQFKHCSIDMTQLYCSNPYQDSALYDDILTELMSYKVEIVAQWLEKDEPLAGGAGLKIKEMRAHDFEGRKELITETSSRISIRSTGHSWCLAQDEGCGGSGIYEKGNCGGCSNGVIDSRFIDIWQEAYRHQKELLPLAAELGPGAVKRIERDLAQTVKILKDAGAMPDNGEKNAQANTL